MKIGISILALMAPAGCLLAASDGEPPALRNNPFSRPPSEAIVAVVAPSIGPELSANPSLDLRATMIGTAKRLANVGGKILRPGDEVQGYVLIAIHERYAVFERNGDETTVYVRPLQVEDDE